MITLSILIKLILKLFSMPYVIIVGNKVYLKTEFNWVKEYLIKKSPS